MRGKGVNEQMGQEQGVADYYRGSVRGVMDYGGNKGVNGAEMEFSGEKRDKGDERWVVFGVRS